MLRTRQCLKTISGAVLILGFSIVIYGGARAAPAEGAGCANDTCKVIRYFHWCFDKQGVGTAYDADDCLMCFTVEGRCDGGSTTTKCKETDVPLNYAKTTVTEVCDCTKVSGISATVEATGNYTGTYKSQGNNVWICK